MPTTSWSLLHQSQSNSCIWNFSLLGSVSSYFLLLGRKYAVSYWSTTHQIWWYHAPRPPALPQNTCEPPCRTICRCLLMVLTSLDNRVIWKNLNQLGEYYIILHRSKSGQCGSHHNSSNTMYASAFHLSMDPPAPTTCGQVVSCSTSTHRTQRTLHSNHMHRLQTRAAFCTCSSTSHHSGLLNLNTRIFPCYCKVVSISFTFLNWIATEEAVICMVKSHSSMPIIQESSATFP